MVASIAIPAFRSIAKPQHSAIRFPIRAGLGKIIERVLGGFDDVPGDKGRPLSRPLLAILQTAFPFEDSPSGKVILS